MQSVQIVNNKNRPSKGRRSRKNSSKARTRQGKKRSRNTRKNNVLVSRSAFHLSECAREYAMALADPFNPKLSAPCVPDQYDFPSRKYRTMLRSSFAAGAAGFGFVAVSAMSTVANDRNCVRTSNSGSSFTTSLIDITTGAAGTASTVNGQSPYPSSDIGPDLPYRVVGLGLRARYTGTELNRAGTMALWKLPPGTVGANADGTTWANLGQLQTTAFFPVTRKWRTIAWSPRVPTEFQFNPIGTSSSVGNNIWDFGIAVNGCVATSTFDYEMVGWYEVIGSTDSVTRSKSDLVGFGAVRDAVEDQITVQDADTGYLNRVFATITRFGASETSGAIVRNIAQQGTTKLLEYL